jgi:hypothetical protein
MATGRRRVRPGLRPQLSALVRVLAPVGGRTAGPEAAGEKRMGAWGYLQADLVRTGRADPRQLPTQP